MNGYNPKEIMVDYELGFISAFKSVFKNSNTRGCHFHSGQSVYRMIVSLGLKKKYNEDEDFSTAIKMLIAIAYVRPEHVNDTLTELVNSKYFEDNVEYLSEIVDYFERTWVGVIKRNVIRNEPMFEVNMWNCYDAVINDLTRTNISI